MHESKELLSNHDSELLIEKRSFSSNNVQVTIHNDYALDIDDYIVSAFNDHNERRHRENLKPHFDETTRYRLICPPKIDGIKLKLDVAPIKFSYFALLEDPDIKNQDHLKAYIHKKIDDVASLIPQELKNDHKYINEYNYIPLGVEIVLITNDAKTLLRRRGKNVATSRYEWDVSFSGYCGNTDLVGEEQELQMWVTVKNEFLEEIDNNIPGDTNNIYFTTLHRNNITRATDLLGYWKVEISSKELANLLSHKYPGTETRVFKTSKKAEEEFVWDTENIIVDFDGNEIAAALKKAGTGIDTLMPEARVALNLALQVLGKPTLTFPDF